MIDNRELITHKHVRIRQPSSLEIHSKILSMSSNPLCVDLTQRFPELSPKEMRAGFVPSPRFERVRFESYHPNPEFESQREALERLRDFVENLPRARKTQNLFDGGLFAGRLFGGKKLEGVGYYLDGGFGVGKTHLLAATWHSFEGQKAFLSFSELFYALGMLGMTKAIETFSSYALLCIDEFELDDPGNTHMASTFLGQLMPAGTHVVTTSNTQPGQLGQGRFNARDFERQIQGMASRFQVLPVDGPDYRQRGITLPRLFSKAELDLLEQEQNQPYARLDVSALNRHLLRIHPARFGKLLEGVYAVMLDDLEPISDQSVALRLVHFIDKVYDLGLKLALTGKPLEKLFGADYRFGPYEKKYSRCLSRLSELFYVNSDPN